MCCKSRVNMATHQRRELRNCLAVLSDKQQAFEWLKIAYREHDTLRLIALKLTSYWIRCGPTPDMSIC